MDHKKNNLHDQFKEISSWLAMLSGGNKIPEYEINKQTLGILHEFMKVNKELDRLSTISIEDVTRKTQEYAAEASFLAETLEGIGISNQSLSQSGQRNLRTLSELALGLTLKDCNHSSYVLAMTDLTNQIEELSSEINVQGLKRRRLEGKIKGVADEKKFVERSSEVLEQQALIEKPLQEKRIKEVHFLKGKAKEYKAMIDNLESAINQTGVSEDLYHESLKEMYELLNEVRGEINSLKSRLSSFHSLPPDMSLARVKIEEAKQELKRLESELYKDIEVLNL
eukprot:Seg2660.1 transcript_id=Seg2660.1/GoldUCD/mRNA.D3Y31 product="HAUS augmin-like complex subunit 1" protein_id=Seg2660.1/GoldUCD/D3Y31